MVRPPHHRSAETNFRRREDRRRDSRGGRRLGPSSTLGLRQDPGRGRDPGRERDRDRGVDLCRGHYRGTILRMR